MADQPQASEIVETMDSTLCSFTPENMAELVADCRFPPDTRFLVPSIGAAVTACPEGFVAVYVKYFTEGNLRLPFTRFFCSVFEYFNMRLPQLNPLGVLRIICFEMQCRALGVVPSAALFHHFFSLGHAGNWYSFTPRRGSKDITADTCFTTTPSSCKQWKGSFFWLGVENFPVKYSQSSVEPSKRVYKRDTPNSRQYRAEDATRLDKWKIKCRSYVSLTLVFCRVSLAYNRPTHELVCFRKRDKKKGKKAESTRSSSGKRLLFLSCVFDAHLM
jgi:hypothetical protein